MRKLAAFAILPLVFTLSLWKLWEGDLYSEIKSGQELLQTLHFPMVDGWSYTYRGSPWYNVEWIGTVVMAWVYSLGGTVALVLFRGIAVAATFLPLAWIGKARPLAALAALPLVYLAMVSRLQLRPELLAFVCCSVLIWIWQKASPLKSKILASAALQLLVVNIHPGGACFTLMFSAFYFLRELEGTSRPAKAIGVTALLASALFSEFLLCPYPLKFWGYLWTHLFYSRYFIVPNIDLRAFPFELWNPIEAGWGVLATLLLIALSVPGFLSIQKNLTRAFAGATAAILLKMSWDHERVIPYFALFVAPFALEALARVKVRACAWLAGLVWWVVIPLHAHDFPRPLGFGENADVYPVGATAFLKKSSPKGNLIHMEYYGDYFLGHLPYPVFMDTRQMIYPLEMQRRYMDMFNDPALMFETIEKYGVNTVIFPMEFFKLIWKGGSRRLDFFPPKRWAVVYFDHLCMVLVSRIPEHDELIRRYEYKSFFPDIPSAVPPARERDPERFSEIARCKSDDPANPDCVSPIILRSQ